MTLEKLVPGWLRKEEVDLYEDAKDMPPLPTVAALPQVLGALGNERPPDFSTADEDKMIFGRAAVMLEQLKRDRAQAQAREDDLKGQLAEAVLARASDTKKIGFLELENVELRNNIAALQSDIEKFREFMSKIKAILDMFGIKAPEKKPRKAKAKKIDAHVAPEQPVV